MRLRVNFSLSTVYGGSGLLGAASKFIQEARNLQRKRQLGTERPNRLMQGLLWRSASEDEDYGSTWLPHRVIRLNQHSVMVEARPYLHGTQQPEPKANRRVRVYWLERAELEQIWVARARSRNVAFFIDPHTHISAVETVEAILRLGLWFPYTEPDLRRAYLRRARVLHPDVGGNEERFVQLQRDRELAAAALDDSWTARTTAAKSEGI
jgi:hypothetical protein